MAGALRRLFRFWAGIPDEPGGGRYVGVERTEVDRIADAIYDSYGFVRLTGPKGPARFASWWAIGDCLVADTTRTIPVTDSMTSAIPTYCTSSTFNVGKFYCGPGPIRAGKACYRGCYRAATRLVEMGYRLETWPEIGQAPEEQVPAQEDEMSDHEDERYSIGQLKDALDRAMKNFEGCDAEDGLYQSDEIAPVVTQFATIASAAISRAEALERINTTLTDQLKQALALQREQIGQHTRYHIG